MNIQSKYCSQGDVLPV